MADKLAAKVHASLPGTYEVTVYDEYDSGNRVFGPTLMKEGDLSPQFEIAKGPSGAGKVKWETNSGKQSSGVIVEPGDNYGLIYIT